jgi:glycosyltransferase involved in cell wall biosynthesis
MSELLLSVVICTHNPRPEYLERTLQALKNQTLPMAEWEIVLVDNACTPPLTSFIDLSWHPHAEIVMEEKLGTYHARIHGIKRSRAPIILCVDDDNVLSPDYFVQALSLGREFPQLGTWGSALIQPEYEKPPAPEFEPFCEILALRNALQDRQTTSQKLNQIVPYGAGMAMRRSIAEAFIASKETDKHAVVFGPHGKNPHPADDLEFSLFAADHGYSYGIFRRLSIVHLIPARRVAPAYLLQIWEAYARGNLLLELARQHIKGAPQFGFFQIARELLAPFLKSIFGGEVRRAIFHRVLKGRWQALNEYKKLKAERHTDNVRA